MSARETWPCSNCGHKHYVSQRCPNHMWTDYCPYEGIDCPADAAERDAADRAQAQARAAARAFGLEVTE